MTAIFVHLSDIHFGQERDDRVHIHNDVKEQLIQDAAEQVRSLPGAPAHGILVTGDIAFSGLQAQYDVAGIWLDKLSDAIGCERFRIQMVPGNHDLDRTKSSTGAKLMLDLIRQGGAAEYEKIMASNVDRAALFARFEDYGRFCEAYDCVLDPEGRYSTNLLVELAPGRSIRFVRLNSSLLCTGDESDAKPELMIGARQFTIQRLAGEESIVLIHHPLNWLKDSDDVGAYLRSRARVLISGHEHNPKVHVEAIEDGTDFMMLAAGATVPFKSNETYTFTYNIIQFDWEPTSDALEVTIYPRAWNAARTCFEADEIRLGSKSPKHKLRCPNFRKGESPNEPTRSGAPDDVSLEDRAPIVEIVAALDSERELSVPPEIDGYRAALLRFFRDLTEGERLRILVQLNAVEADFNEPMTRELQRRLLDWIAREGRLGDVEIMMSDMLTNRRDGGEL